MVDDVVSPARPDDGRKPMRFEKTASGLLGEPCPSDALTRNLGEACRDLRGPQFGKVDFDELVVLPCGHAGFLPRISVFVQYLSWLAQWHMTAPVIRVRPTRPHHDRSDHCASPSRTHLELAFVTSSAAQTRSPVRRRPDHRLSFIQVNAAPAIKASSSPAASSALMRSINQAAAPPNQ